MISILTEKQEPVIDMFNLLNRFTLDSIGEIGFGADIGSLENPVSPFLKSFDEAQRILFKRFVWRGLHWSRFFLSPQLVGFMVHGFPVPRSFKKRVSFPPKNWKLEASPGCPAGVSCASWVSVRRRRPGST